MFERGEITSRSLAFDKIKKSKYIKTNDSLSNNKQTKIKNDIIDTNNIEKMKKENNDGNKNNDLDEKFSIQDDF